MELLSVYSLNYELLAILNDNSPYSAREISEKKEINKVDTLSFKISTSSSKWQFLINENLVKWKGEYYFIKNPSCQHDTSSKEVSIECKHLSSSLGGILNTKLDLIGKTATELMTAVIDTTNTGWSIGTINVVNKNRALQSVEQSVFTNLSKIAEMYDATLIFHSDTKTVDLINTLTDRGIQFRKGKNLKSIQLDYNSDDMVTRIYAFGGTTTSNANGTTSEVEVNLLKAIVNGVEYGKSYVENYSYYLSQGYTQEYINSHPELFKKEQVWNASEYTDPTVLYEDTVKKLEKICKPKVTCSISSMDLSNIPLYRTEKPILGEFVYIYDEDLNISIKAQVTSISVNNAELQNAGISVTLSNEIEYNSVLSQLIDTTKLVNMSTNKLGETKASLINGVIDVEKAKLNSTSSFWYTDEQGNMVFENDTKTKAMKLGAGIFGIANSKLPDGTYDWQTFGDGDGFIANCINAGILNADLIKAGILKSFNNKSWVDMEDGTFNFGDKITFDGESFKIHLTDSETYEDAINDIANEIVGVPNIATTSRFFANSKVIVTNPSDSYYSDYPNPPLGGVFNNIDSTTGRLTSGKIFTPANGWALMNLVNIYKETNDSTVLDKAKIVGDYFVNSIISASFYGTTFKLMPNLCSYINGSWTMVTDEIAVRNQYHAIWVLLELYKVSNDVAYKNTAIALMKSVGNIYNNIKQRAINDAELPTWVVGTMYDTINTSGGLTPTMSFSWNVFNHNTADMLSRAVPIFIEVVGNTPMTDWQGTSFTPQVLIDDFKTHIQYMYDHKGLTMTPTGLPYGFLRYDYADPLVNGRVDPKPQNYDWLTQTWGDVWWATDLEAWIILGFANLGLTSVATAYRNAYMNLKISDFTDKFVLFRDRYNYDGTSVSDDKSISICVTALLYTVDNILGIEDVTLHDLMTSTLSTYQIQSSNLNLDGSFKWDVLDVNAYIEVKATGEICYSPYIIGSGLKNKLNEFIDVTFNDSLDSIQNQLDGKAETFYQTTMPHVEYTNVTSSSTFDTWVGDLWYDNTSTSKKTYIYTKTANGSNFDYKWSQQEIPKDIFDTLDGKKTIYTTQPTSYQKDDLWILESDNIHSPNKQGEILTSTTTSSAYNSAHWVVKVRYTDDSSLDTFVTNTYSVDKTSLQSQIDGKIETWFQATDPNTWTEGDRVKHNGDMWFKSDTKALYRYNSTSNTWEQVQDQKAIDAYNNASTAQTTANSKRTVFTAQPTTPYLVGDLWLTSTSSGQGDIYKCTVARTTGSYNSSDWVLATKYTDDTTANTALTNANNAQSTANTASANASTSLAKLADIASDSKLTPVEKTNTKNEWDTIVSEKTKIDSQATTYGITTEKTSYGNAYTNLSDYITPLLADLTTTSDIVGSTFRANFKSYYDARQDLLNAISSKAKTLADTAQNGVNDINNNTLPALTTRVTKVEQLTTDDAIISTVSNSVTYHSDTLLPKTTDLTVSRDALAINPLTAYNPTSLTTIANNVLVSISSGGQSYIPYLGGLEVIDGKFVTFEKQTDRVQSAESKITQQADKISLVVSEDNGINSVNSASIVTAINNGTSKINMSATNIDLSGYVTFTNLTTSGQTEINGGNIKGGTLTLGGGSNANGLFSLKDASNVEIVKMDNTGITVNNGKITIKDNSGTSIITGSGVSASGINGGTFDASKFTVQNLEVGTNVTMKKGSTITWDNTGVNGVIPPNATQVGARPSSWTPNASDVGALSSTYIDGNNVFTANVYANKITGDTINVASSLSFVKGGVTIFKIGQNLDGTSPTGKGQLFLNDTASLDTNPVDVGGTPVGAIRLRANSTNYIRIDEQGRLTFVCNGTEVNIVDTNGILQTGGSAVNVTVTPKFG